MEGRQGQFPSRYRTKTPTHGQLEPIWLHPDDESIVDGRNRHRACCALDIKPKFRYWNKQGSLVDFVVSLNLHRRQLTTGQAAMVALNILEYLAAEAKERQRTAAEQTNAKRQEKTLPQSFGEASQKETQPVAETAPAPAIPVATPASQQAEKTDATAQTEPATKPAKKTTKHKNESATQAAKLTGTNRQYIADAKKITEQAPEVAEMVRSGGMTIPEAKQLAKFEPEKRSQAIQLLKQLKALCSTILANKIAKYFVFLNVTTNANAVM